MVRLRAASYGCARLRGALVVAYSGPASVLPMLPFVLWFFSLRSSPLLRPLLLLLVRECQPRSVGGCVFFQRGRVLPVDADLEVLSAELLVSTRLFDGVLGLDPFPRDLSRGLVCY